MATEVEALREKVRELERRERDRRDKTRLYTAFAFSLVTTFFIVVLLWHPMTDGFVGEPRWHGGLIVLPILVGFASGISMGVATTLYDWHEPKLWPYVVSALIVPVIALGVWAFVMRPDHAVQQEAVRTFERYTARIPGVEPNPEIARRFDKSATVCSTLGRSEDAHLFCTEVVTTLPQGEQVIGGFKAEGYEDVSFDGDGIAGPIIEFYGAYDCFGEVAECAES